MIGEPGELPQPSSSETSHAAHPAHSSDKPPANTPNTTDSSQEAIEQIEFLLDRATQEPQLPTQTDSSPDHLQEPLSQSKKKIVIIDDTTEEDAVERTLRNQEREERIQASEKAIQEKRETNLDNLREGIAKTTEDFETALRGEAQVLLRDGRTRKKYQIAGPEVGFWSHDGIFEDEEGKHGVGYGFEVEFDQKNGEVSKLKQVKGIILNGYGVTKQEFRKLSGVVGHNILIDFDEDKISRIQLQWSKDNMPPYEGLLRGTPLGEFLEAFEFIPEHRTFWNREKTGRYGYHGTLTLDLKGKTQYGLVGSKELGQQPLISLRESEFFSRDVHYDAFYDDFRGYQHPLVNQEEFLTILTSTLKGILPSNEVEL